MYKNAKRWRHEERHQNPNRLIHTQIKKKYIRTSSVSNSFAVLTWSKVMEQNTKRRARQGETDIFIYISLWKSFRLFIHGTLDITPIAWMLPLIRWNYKMLLNSRERPRWGKNRTDFSIPPSRKYGNVPTFHSKK